MSKKRQSARYGRDAPAQKLRTAYLTDPDAWKVLCLDGYKPIGQCPEVQMCVGIFADLISAMTIHLMANGPDGDIRIVNELSRKLDITPNRDMTRTALIQWLVRTLMTEGNAVILPEYSGTMLENLQPVPPSRVSFVQDGPSYKARIGGTLLPPDEILHFVLNPDKTYPWRGAGYTGALREIVKNLRQANATKQAILESPAPSIIVKVDGLTEEFASVEGRKKLRAQYLDSSENGEPWFIPAETFSVEKIPPLTLNDLAIKDNLELDKRSVAAVFGVPPFLVGVGEFSAAAYQNFLATRVAPIAHEIEQELTRKLLYSPDMYIRMNMRSLYNYSISELIQAGEAMCDRMALGRNEWRDWMGLAPDPRMNELLALENYIPADRLGDQKKLNSGGGEEA